MAKKVLVENHQQLIESLEELEKEIDVLKECIEKFGYIWLDLKAYIYENNDLNNKGR